MPASQAQADEFIQSLPRTSMIPILSRAVPTYPADRSRRLCIARALLKKPKDTHSWTTPPAPWTRKTDAIIRKAMREEFPDTTKLIIAQRISSVQEADHDYCAG